MARVIKWIIVLLCLIGCTHLDDLSDKAIVFHSGEIMLSDEGYGTIEYNDKVYVMFGNIKAKGLLNDISYAYGDCLGYVDNDKSDRIYALADESIDEWLIEYNTDGFMEQPIVLREISTKGKEVPDYVESFGYSYWGD